MRQPIGPRIADPIESFEDSNQREKIDPQEYYRTFDFDKMRTRKNWQEMMEHANRNFEELFGLTNYQKAVKQRAEELGIDVDDPKVMNQLHLRTITFSYNLSLANPELTQEDLDQEAYLLGLLLLEDGDTLDEIGVRPDNKPSRYFQREERLEAKRSLASFTDDVVANVGDPHEWLAIHRNRFSTITIDYALQNRHFFMETGNDDPHQALNEAVDREVLGGEYQQSHTIRLETITRYTNRIDFGSRLVLKDVLRWLAFFDPGPEDPDNDTWNGYIDWIEAFIAKDESQIHSEELKKLQEIYDEVKDFYLDAVPEKTRVSIEATQEQFHSIIERSQEVLSQVHPEAVKELEPLVNKAVGQAERFNRVEYLQDQINRLEEIVLDIRNSRDGYFDDVVGLEAYEGGRANSQLYEHKGAEITRIISEIREEREALGLAEDYFPDLEDLRSVIFEHYNNPDAFEELDEWIRQYQKLSQSIITERDVQELNRSWQELSKEAQKVQRKILRDRTGLATFSTDHSGDFTDKFLSSIEHVSEQISQQTEVLEALEEAGKEPLISNFNHLASLHNRMLELPDADQPYDRAKDRYSTAWNRFCSENRISGLNANTQLEEIPPDKRREFANMLIQFHLDNKLETLSFVDRDLAFQVEQARVSQLEQMIGIRQLAKRAQVKHEVFPDTSLEPESVDRLVASWSVTAHALHRMNRNEVKDLFVEMDRILKVGGQATLFPMDYSRDSLKWDQDDIKNIIKEYNDENDAQLVPQFTEGQGSYRKHSVLIVTKAAAKAPVQ